MSDDNLGVTISYGGQEVKTDTKTIANLADQLQGEYRLDVVHIGEGTGVVEFAGEVKTVGVKPIKHDGSVVGVEMQITLLAPLNGEVLRALSDRAGNVVRVTVAPFDRTISEYIDETTGEIRGRA